MATLKVWTDFYKRKNSTKRPTGGIDVEVKLKENTSIENPVFICNNLGNANYCQYAGNYYFVEDIIFVTNTIVELHCSMDALATNKDAISGYTCFVERAESNYDLMIVDDAISQKSTGSYTAGSSVSLSDMVDSTNGIYVVRILGRNGVTGYVMSESKVKDLFNYANDFNNFSDVFKGLDEIVDGAVAGVFNPDKFIVSCKWFPLKAGAFNLKSPENIILGNWNSNVSAQAINYPKIVFNKTISLPTPIYSDFRKNDSSWSKIFIYLPCIGSIELDPMRFPNGVGVRYVADAFSGGLCVLLADADENIPIMKFDSKIGVDVQIGRAYADVIGAMQAENNRTAAAGGIISAGGSIISSGSFGDAGGIMSGTGGIIGSVANYQNASIEVSKAKGTPLQTMIGSVGSIATIQAMDSILIGIFSYDTCESSVTYGKPLMKNVLLGTLTGYVKCSNASVPSNAYGSEKDTINSYLNSGFYME